MITKSVHLSMKQKQMDLSFHMGGELGISVRYSSGYIIQARFYLTIF